MGAPRDCSRRTQYAGEEIIEPVAVFSNELGISQRKAELSALLPLPINNGDTTHSRSFAPQREWSQVRR
jgi:hypothetical protein